MEPEQATVTRLPGPYGMSPETQRLIEKLKEGKPGDVLTDDELREVCGKNTRVGCEGYANLWSAIRHCDREHGVAWSRVRGAWCIKCLGATELQDEDDASNKSIHRKTKRDLRRLKIATTHTNGMDDAGRTQLNLRIAQKATMLMFSSSQTRKKLDARNITKPLDMNRLLDAWKD